MDLNQTDSSSYSEISLPRSIRFWLLLLLDIPSICCSFYLLYYFITKQNLRSALNNHTIILLLLISLSIQFIDIPLYLIFLHLGFVWPQTFALCILWWYVGTAMYNTISILVAWSCFERHILVFHEHCFSTGIKQWLYHYIPIICCLSYPIIFYLSVIYLSSCDEQFFYDFNQGWCNFNPCYYNDKTLSLYDLIINSILPCLFIFFFSLILIIRILWTKYTHTTRLIQWKKYRKMSIQLLSISSLFILFNLPLMIYYLLYICGFLFDDINPQIQLNLTFLAYFSILFLPFVTLFSLPNNSYRYHWRKLMNFIRKHRSNIQPDRTGISTAIQLRRLQASSKQNHLTLE